jgi:hypothetical protein
VPAEAYAADRRSSLRSAGLTRALVRRATGEDMAQAPIDERRTCPAQLGRRGRGGEADRSRAARSSPRPGREKRHQHLFDFLANNTSDALGRQRNQARVASVRLAPRTRRVSVAVWWTEVFRDSGERGARTPQTRFRADSRLMPPARMNLRTRFRNPIRRFPMVCSSRHIRATVRPAARRPLTVSSGTATRTAFSARRAAKPVGTPDFALRSGAGVEPTEPWATRPHRF